MKLVLIILIIICLIFTAFSRKAKLRADFKRCKDIKGQPECKDWSKCRWIDGLCKKG
jgi:hypothetical protein